VDLGAAEGGPYERIIGRCEQCLFFPNLLMGGGLGGGDCWACIKPAFVQNNVYPMKAT
jgi:hypothetical protein